MPLHGPSAAAGPLPRREPEPFGLARNKIFAALPHTDRDRIFRALQPVAVPLSAVLCEAGGSLDSVYFPTTCVVSTLYTTADGATAETSLIGNDGLCGISAVLGSDTASNQTVVVVAGEAYRMKSQALRAEFASCPALQSLLLRYTHALIRQISQTAVCNRLHGAEQRLCRWLLMCQDRLRSSELQMTQELISHMLGGRRETVTVAAGRLQDAGLIRYSRGHITILDRARLESFGCECYSMVGAASDRPRGAITF
jgi:CRP-like cAMP-binding protein